MRADRVPDAAAVVARARGENFAVASRLLPRRVRHDLLAVYGFARLADDLGDDAPGDRGELLDWLEREVDAIYGGTPSHPLVLRLASTVRAHGIPREPLDRLIQANRQDQRVRRYRTFADLLDYCALSANPVGHLVLYVLEAATEERVALSNSICTGLQLVEHWQDVAEDLGRGRVYLPEEDLDRFGVRRDDLAAGSAPPALRNLMAFEVARAMSLLEAGAPLARSLGGAPGLAVAGFVAGGRAALDAIRRADYDVLSRTPRASRLGRMWAFVRALAGMDGASPSFRRNRATDGLVPEGRRTR